MLYPLQLNPERAIFMSWDLLLPTPILGTSLKRHRMCGAPQLNLEKQAILILQKDIRLGEDYRRHGIIL